VKSFLIVGIFLVLNISLPAQDRNSKRVPVQKIDSMQSHFYVRSDSLKLTYEKKFNQIHSARRALEAKLGNHVTGPLSSNTLTLVNKSDSLQDQVKCCVDSVSCADVHFRKIKRSLDSLNSVRDSTLMTLNSKLESLKEKTVERLNKLNLPPEFSENVSKVTGEVKGFQIPSSELGISSLSIGDSDVLGKLPNLDLQSPLEGTGQMNDLKNINGNLPDLPGISQVGEYGKDLPQVTNGNLGELKELPNGAETQAAELSGLNEIKDQTKALDEYKDLPGKLKNPDSLKSLAIEQAKQMAANQFAGHEQELQEGMDMVSKFKKKYGSFNSLEDIRSRPRNPMKGVPLIERVIPGIGMQIQKQNDEVLVDFNPYAGYKFTPRITAGLGWNQRVAYNFNQNKFNPEGRIYGPRVFGEYKLWRGYSPRAELEVMNTNVPPLAPAGTVDPAVREWVWGVFVGIKKEYKLFKKINGTASVMTRLFNPDHKSPYADVVSVRFGFEFPMKKKMKNQEAEAGH
jgi:hypothetical protein